MPKAKRARARSELDRMAALVEGQPTKAAKIRRLGAAGYKRQAIADFLGISYQHVRNVLAQARGASPPHQFAPPTAALGVAESGAPYGELVTKFDAEARVARFWIDDMGRITLTPELLKVLDTAPGRLITAYLEEGELRIMNIEAMLRFVRRGIPPWKPGEPLWSDELVAERRAEAAREAAKEEREFRKWRRKSS